MESQTLSLQQAFDLAYAHHTQGRLAEAETIYRQIIAARPAHADALHMLGVIALQLGKDPQAIEMIEKAIASNPKVPEYRSNLGLALTRMQRFDEAIAQLTLAVQAKPQLSDGHNNLGNAFRSTGQIDRAMASFREAIRHNPHAGEARSNLASALRSKGSWQEAEAEYRLALQARPRLFEAHIGLAEVLAAQRRFDEAVPFFNHAIQLNPRSPDAFLGHADALRALNRMNEAVAAYQSAIQLNPESAEALNNYGIALRNLGRLPEASDAFRKAIKLNPAHAAAYSNLGNVLKEQNQTEEAIAAQERAIQLDPSLFEAYTNLGNMFRDVGELSTAIEMYRKAVALAPDISKFHSNLLYALYFSPDFTPKRLHEEETAWAARHAAPLKASARPHSRDRDPNRKLRIGFVSPDFREHCQAFFTLPLLRNLNREQFHITCYSSVVRADAFTQQIRSLCDQWRDISGISDAAAAEWIRRDNIDILIDLTLHMAGNRLLVFAHKPAPVQVSWLGYPGSTGLDSIDWRITDPHLDPEGFDPTVYSERSKHLPDTFWCYDPLSPEPGVNDLPARANGHITFGCFNNFSKVHCGVIDLWARVLKEVPGSRMIILADVGRAREKTLATFAGHGIEASRIEFAGKRPRTPYLELYQRIDITLDTFPYNGHTTSLDSLWMGVPVVSLVGDHPVARAGLTLNRAIGLSHLAADLKDAYVEQAAKLAADWDRLADLRRSLRSTMQASPLMDAPRFTRHFEAALRQMWQSWCAS